ncbi:MAG: acetolactate synthase [Rhodospirillaceae bacterium]|nr:acetolactate synthase [Rhodospirillaceae bacterium]
MIKVSDYIAQFLVDNNIQHVFAITGGASIHMIHSIGEREDIEFICPHHEQAGAMAADVYSRVSDNMGCAIATSGPGAMNMITGIAGAWFDSVPVIYLTGQVARFRFKGSTGVRQMGFQETDVVSMVQSVTKYTTQIMEAGELRYELEKAVYLAKEGRPGPVVIDIPDDLQREMVDPTDLHPYVPPTIKENPTTANNLQIDEVIHELKKAKRPVIIPGFGVRLADAHAEFLELIEMLDIPVCPSWAAADMVHDESDLLAGTFGTHGSRSGNFTVQNADLIIAVGARLSTRETGHPMSSWARSARCIIVDIDKSELKKFPAFGKKIHLSIQSDAKIFLKSLIAKTKKITFPSRKNWKKIVINWRHKYPACSDNYRKEKLTNPYVFVDALSNALEEDDIIITDTGGAIAWIMQGFKIKPGQRIIHSFNNTPMGFGLPGAIGAALAYNKKKRIICVTGDGSVMMNLQEFATVQKHNLPIKTFIFNNSGYIMVQQTQEQWLNSKYFATSTSDEGGLSFPDFRKTSEAFNIPHTGIVENQEVESVIKKTLAISGPTVCDVKIPDTARVWPQSRFGFPIEDSEPLLPRKEFLENMIIEPMPASLNAPPELLKKKR